MAEKVVRSDEEDCMLIVKMTCRFEESTSGGLGEEARRMLTQEEKKEADAGSELAEEIRLADTMNRLMTQVLVADLKCEEDHEYSLDDPWQPMNIRNQKDLEKYIDFGESQDTWSVVPHAEANEVACYHLGELVFVHVYFDVNTEHGFKVEIRQWLLAEDAYDVGMHVAGSGVTLLWEEWVQLMSRSDDMGKLVKDVLEGKTVDEKLALGRDRFLSILSPWPVIVLRLWQQRSPNGPYFPGRRGIGLKVTQYRHLLKLEQVMWKNKLHITSLAREFREEQEEEQKKEKKDMTDREVRQLLIHMAERVDTLTEKLNVDHEVSNSSTPELVVDGSCFVKRQRTDSM